MHRIHLAMKTMIGHFGVKWSLRVHFLCICNCTMYACKPLTDNDPQRNHFCSLSHYNCNVCDVTSPLRSTAMLMYAPSTAYLRSGLANLWVMETFGRFHNAKPSNNNIQEWNATPRHVKFASRTCILTIHPPDRYMQHILRVGTWG